MKEVSSCSHQDEARKGVSVTAHGVAFMRGQEKLLFEDPFAQRLGGDIGRSWAEQEVERKFGELTETNARDLYAHIIVRTKVIDDSITHLLEDHQDITQVCALGAGLDTRPWRMNLHGVARRMDYFELDFPEIFDYKLSMLHDIGAETSSVLRYHPVAADLSTPFWSDALKQSGYDPSQPTIWLVEGVTGYLSEDENRALFARLASFSAPGSQLLVTFVTPLASKTVGVALHRFMPQDPLLLLKESGGWAGFTVDLQDAAVALRRASDDETKGFKGYVLACVAI